MDSKHLPSNTYEIGAVAEGYDLLRDIPEAILAEYGKRLIRQVPAQGLLLEAGLGTGRLLAQIARENTEQKFHLVGVDSSVRMVDLTKKRLISLGLESSVELVTQDLIKYLEINKEGFDAIHFKAILHCFVNPMEVLDKMILAIKLGGKIVTGHEESQSEAAIEGLQNPYPKIGDSDLEDILKHYFEIRKEIDREFIPRIFPAGDSLPAVKYLQKNGLRLEVESGDEGIKFTRQFRINDVLEAIRAGTFGVFRDGLTNQEIAHIYSILFEYSKNRGVDLERVREIPARWRQYILTK